MSREGEKCSLARRWLHRTERTPLLLMLLALLFSLLWLPLPLLLIFFSGYIVDNVHLLARSST